MPSRLYLSPPHMGGSEPKLVTDVFDSNWIAPIGPMVDAFEAGLARVTGNAHVAALSSGTAALHLALILAGIGPGDAVWGPTMTFIGGVAPIRQLGADPVFVDARASDLLIDLDLLEEALSGARRVGRLLPKVIITTDLYGNVVDMARMRRIADEFGAVWISDTAEALGSAHGGEHAGKGADFVILSFNGNKIITTSGGGALASDNGEAIARARFLATQARENAPHYEHVTCGFNYRLSNICAAIGVGQLLVLAERVARRRAIFDAYRAALADVPGIHFHAEQAGSHVNRWLTTIIIDPVAAGFDREQARRALEADDIESRPLWKPMHVQPVFTGCAAIGGQVAEAAFAEGLCLPSGSSMDQADIERVVDRLMALVD